jgi:hypothetical protein
LLLDDGKPELIGGTAPLGDDPGRPVAAAALEGSITLIGIGTSVYPGGITTHVVAATGGMTLVEPDVKPEGIPVTEGGRRVAEGVFRSAEFAAALLGGRTALGIPEAPGSATEAVAPRPLTPAFGGRTALGSGRAVTLAGFEDGGSEASGGTESAGLPAAILLGLGGNPLFEIPAGTDDGRAVMAVPLGGNPLFGIPAVMDGGRAAEPLGGNPLFGIPAVMDGGRAVRAVGIPLAAGGVLTTLAMKGIAERRAA